MPTHYEAVLPLFMPCHTPKLSVRENFNTGMSTSWNWAS